MQGQAREYNQNLEAFLFPYSGHLFVICLYQHFMSVDQLSLEAPQKSSLLTTGGRSHVCES